MDKFIIEAIVGSHIREIHRCYTKRLARNSGLNGVVTIGFTISAAGRVTSSAVRSSTVANARVGRCIARAVKRWKFPKPEGTAQVVSSFTLEPGPWRSGQAVAGD